ncbi:MAG TPA: methyltransferase domain-containing protein [Bacteroidales bacterium]|nr:methyltransferase domain-containing protein [Bacteroidales bacterium]
MEHSLLQILRCPLTKKELRLQVLSEFERKYGNRTIREIKDGVLFSDAGLIFPVIDGIPRMLIEAFEDYAAWFEQNYPDYETAKKDILQKYPGLIAHCLRKNRRTKKSFALEWSLLNYKKQDKIWHDDAQGIEELFFRESLESPTSLKEKSVIDVGCGHGLNTTAVGKYCKNIVGVELGRAVENAYANNTLENVSFVQADLQFLPFAENTFDLLLSGGVIHHTTNTELSFCQVETILIPGGKICLWLYHPVNDFLHNAIDALRRVTSKLPVRLQFFLYLIFIFPVTYSVKRIKGRRINWREEMIDLMDSLSPEFRWEHTHDEAASWLQKKGYSDIRITTDVRFGFSITGQKP